MATLEEVTVRNMNEGGDFIEAVFAFVQEMRALL